MNSIVEVGWQVGWMIGPAISAAVQARSGFGPLFLATSVLYGVGAGLAYLFFRDAEQRPARAGIAVVEGEELVA